jgi:YVTN family beta-propeller protein
LAVSHQTTNHLATTSGDDIHWGMLVQNLIRLVEIDALLDPDANLHRRSEMGHISQPGAGEADPAGLVLVGDDEWLVAISGSNEALLTNSSAGIHSRIPTGARPLAVLFDPVNKLGYTINQLSDSITVIDTNEGTAIRSISLGPTPEPTAITRGERLFYNGGLSHDRWLSCHSCHPDGHTTGLLVDTKSDGTYGTPKRIITLLGTRDANPWAWNGEFRELHGQVRKSIATSMQGRNPTSEQVNDIVTFLHTLEPAPPLSHPSTDAEKAVVGHGRQVFDSLGCAKCHVPSLTYTSNEVYDVGLEDEAGVRKFNPPFLRGVSQRDSLFHDGRAKSLREALVDLSHQISQPVAEPDMDALLEFLKTL